MYILELDLASDATEAVQVAGSGAKKLPAGVYSEDDFCAFAVGESSSPRSQARQYEVRTVNSVLTFIYAQ